MATNLLEKTIGKLTEWGITDMKTTIHEIDWRIKIHIIEFIVNNPEHVSITIEIEEKKGKYDSSNTRFFSYLHIRAFPSTAGFHINNTDIGFENSLIAIEQICKGKTCHFIMEKLIIEENKAKILENMATIRKLERQNEDLLSQINDIKRSEINLW